MMIGRIRLFLNKLGNFAVRINQLDLGTSGIEIHLVHLKVRGYHPLIKR
jgi:hypothetical protein